MTKSEFVKKIAAKCNVSISVADTILTAFVAVCSETLVQEKMLPLTGFGILKVQKRNARNGRNPRTGEALTIPACNVTKFTMSRVLKDALNK